MPDFRIGTPDFVQEERFGRAFAEVDSWVAKKAFPGASLIAGFVTVLLLQPAAAGAIGMPASFGHLAFPFQLCAAH